MEAFVFCGGTVLLGVFIILHSPRPGFLVGIEIRKGCLVDSLHVNGVQS